jgi:hypothetical protein
MHRFFATSVFLDSTCFSPPYPLYHDPLVMSSQQLLGHRLIQPSSPDLPNNVETPLTRPSHQEKLLQASAAPNYIHRLSFPTYPSALNTVDMLPRETLEIKKTVLAPFHVQAAPVVSRMYFNHFPGFQIVGNQVNNLLRKELHLRVIDTTPDFIYISRSTEAMYRQGSLQYIIRDLSRHPWQPLCPPVGQAEPNLNGANKLF